MNKKFRVLLILTVLIMLLLITCGLAQAALLDQMDDAKEGIITFIKDAAKIVAVVFIAWAGIIFWGAGGDERSLSNAKSKMLYFFIAVFLIFTCDLIVDTVWDWFG